MPLASVLTSNKLMDVKTKKTAIAQGHSCNVVGLAGRDFGFEVSENIEDKKNNNIIVSADGSSEFCIEEHEWNQ